MKTQRTIRMGAVIGQTRRPFLTGLLVVVPIAGTILILKWVFEAIDGILAPVVEAIFGRPIPGIGFAVMLVIVLLAGMAASNVLGRRLIQRGELLVEAVPMVREIHDTFKQILQSVLLPHRGGFKEVVLVEFPRPGMRTIGFVTNRVKDREGRDLAIVYIPTAPNPTSGYLEIIPAADLEIIDMPVDEAIRMIVSGGMISPEVIAPKEEPRRATGEGRPRGVGEKTIHTGEIAQTLSERAVDEIWVAQQGGRVPASRSGWKSKVRGE